MNMHTAFNQRLAEEIRVEAARQNINSQSELGRMSGMGQSTIRRYFYSCEREIPVSALMDVARALRVSPSELLRRAEGEREDIKRPVARRVTARSIAPRRQND